MRRQLIIKMHFSSRRQLKVIFHALEPETKNLPTHRSKVSLKLRNSSLVLKIDAKDTGALRATANAFLRWMDSLQQVLISLN